MAWNGKIQNATQSSPAIRPLKDLEEPATREEQDAAAAIARNTVDGGNSLPISAASRKTDGYEPRS